MVRGRADAQPRALPATARCCENHPPGAGGWGRLGAPPRALGTGHRGALATTIIPILIQSSEVHRILQEDGADGGQVLLGGEMEGGLAVLCQLIHFGPCKKLPELIT